MKEQRTSPLLGQLLLFAVFLVLACVGVATVIVPELTEDPEAADPEAAEDGSAASSGDGGGDTSEPDE